MTRLFRNLLPTPSFAVTAVLTLALGIGLSVAVLSPTDPVTLGVVGAFLLGVAGVASVIPARSSTRIDPVEALRAEG
jgi:ABC-type antimicrobial peptide transport system permease subunit